MFPLFVKWSLLLDVQRRNHDIWTRSTIAELSRKPTGHLPGDTRCKQSQILGTMKFSKHQTRQTKYVHPILLEEDMYLISRR